MSNIPKFKKYHKQKSCSFLDQLFPNTKVQNAYVYVYLSLSSFSIYTHTHIHTPPPHMLFCALISKKGLGAQRKTNVATLSNFRRQQELHLSQEDMAVLFIFLCSRSSISSVLLKIFTEHQSWFPSNMLCLTLWQMYKCLFGLPAKCIVGRK